MEAIIFVQSPGGTLKMARTQFVVRKQWNVHAFRVGKIFFRFGFLFLEKFYCKDFILVENIYFKPFRIFFFLQKFSANSAFIRIFRMRITCRSPKIGHSGIIFDLLFASHLLADRLYSALLFILQPLLINFPDSLRPALTSWHFLRDFLFQIFVASLHDRR